MVWNQGRIKNRAATALKDKTIIGRKIYETDSLVRPAHRKKGK